MTQTQITKKPIVISNIRDLADNGMTLGLYCLPCDRWGEVIPQEWLDAGKPNIDYVAKKFKCGDCGETASKQVRPYLKRMGLSRVTC
ncbi:MAG TPA: hypothetical protein EYO53_05240 [Alphaproteobacteria bacterium]|nr:hypothetical protein [Alphaproteobacteria bacterium]